MYQSDPAKPDWLIFGLSAGLLALVIFPVVLLPEDSQSVINATFALITQELGVIYIILTAGIIGLLLYVALCPWGNIRLGRETARYSKFSWISMLFCCGIGGSVIYWGATEWVFYYTAPRLRQLRDRMRRRFGPPATACFTGVPGAGPFTVFPRLPFAVLTT